MREEESDAEEEAAATEIGPCVRCGHDPACGFASSWSEATGELWYCHDDDHSCYGG